MIKREIEKMQLIDKKNIKNDISAAISTAIISIPGNIIFGIIAFSPLGPQYTNLGILSGFICSIILGGFSAIFSNTKGLISGPRAGVSIAIASFLTYLINFYAAANTLQISNSYILALLFGTLIAAGFIQMVLGIFKMGMVIKYISYPVIVGFINSKVILLVKSQIWNMTGLENTGGTFFSNFQNINIFAVFVTAVTVLLYFIIKKIFKKIPVHLIVIVLACFVHYMFDWLQITDNPGKIIGSIDLNLKQLLYYFDGLAVFGNSGFFVHITEMIITAFGIAVLSSTDTLLTSLAIQNITYESVNANRELLVQGIGNIFSTLFGGIVGGGSSTRSMTNVQTGGRNKIAAILYAFLIFIILVVLTPIIQYLPLAVIAGLAIIIAIKMFNRWMLSLFGKIRSKKNGVNKEVLSNLIIIVLVILITLMSNLVYAALSGMAISIILYVYKKSRVSILRKTYSGAKIHSKRQLNLNVMELLNNYGSEICILELESSVFFGTADELSNRIDTFLTKKIKFLIIDLKRISDIDSSGIRILERIYAKAESKDCLVCFAYLASNSMYWGLFNEMGFFKRINSRHVFIDSDSALEYCEDLLVKKHRNKLNKLSKLGFSAFNNFNGNDFEIIRKLLYKKLIKQGEYICKQGDESDSMYFISKGSADITIRLSNNQREKRLETLNAGTFFGEMAMIEEKPRSANVVAKTDLTCLILKKEKFTLLREKHSDTYLKMMNNILKTLSSRIRYANITISELET